MARLARCFLLSLFIIIGFNATSARAANISKLLTTEWFPAGADCLNRSLSYIHHKKLDPVNEAKLLGAANYNDQIFKRYDDLSPTEWNTEVLKTVDHFAAYDGKFDPVSFKKWLQKNPIPVKEKTTIGDYLKAQNEAFLKVHPEGKIEDLVGEIPDALRGIAKTCSENIECHERKIGQLIAQKLNNTCVAKFKAEALRSMITGLALTNSGYALSTAKHPENGFPFDMMATSLIWTPIIAELGCRNTLEKGSIGKKIDFGQRVTFSAETAKHKANNYINYMILSPVSDATYVGFHTAFQVATGKKDWKDVHIWDLTKQVAALTLWDAIYPVPRMVMISDPFYLKGMPAITRMYNRVLPGKTGNVASYLTDWGSRVGMTFINTNLVNMWISGADRWWDTKFRAAPQKKIETKTAK